MATATEAEEQFIQRRWDSISLATLIVAGCAFFFILNYNDKLPQFSGRKLVFALMAFLALANLIGYGLLRNSSTFFSESVSGYTPVTRRRSILFAALFLLLLLCILCAVTGGSEVSPFSQFITSAGSLAIVFAKRRPIRVVLALAGVVGYVVTSNVVLKGVFHIPAAESLSPGWDLFVRSGCVAITAMLTIYAGWRIGLSAGANKQLFGGDDSA
ncbi:MAG TPA: hypothetical protein VGM77_12285 [Gemmatimonadales bacterium]|jgi:hypothetical protein